MSSVFVFPGQGSQSIGMLSDMGGYAAIVQETFEEASDALGYDLWNVVANGPETQLNQTHITQPAMLAAGVALWRVWQSLSLPQPTAMAGHSLGEYTALVCSEALSYIDALRVVSERGKLMQAAVPAGEGAMAAILGLEDENVIAVCDEAAQGEIVEAVNFNSPGQVVIAGNASAVERAITLAQEKGAKRALKLAVSVPSHCALMKDAAESLRSVLNDVAINTPNVPVIHNVDAETHEGSDAIRDILAQQLHQPVRWVEVVQRLNRDYSPDLLIECGPGKVLAGLSKRIDRRLSALPLFNSASIEKAVAAVNAE